MKDTQCTDKLIKPYDIILLCVKQLKHLQNGCNQLHLLRLFCAARSGANHFVHHLPPPFLQKCCYGFEP